MSFACTEKVITMSNIKRSIETGEYLFDNVVQRGLVWSPQQKSDFIYSVAMECRLGEALVKKKTIKVDGEDRVVYDVFDGKQRMNTIYQYMIGGFKLKTIKPITYYDANKKKKTVDISGKAWDEIPGALQLIIQERTLRLAVFEDITEDELIELFILTNNGKPLTSKNKALAHCKDRENMLRIGEHELFRPPLLTKKGLENKNQVTIIAKCYLMLNRNIDEIDFGARSLNADIEEILIEKDEKKKLNAIFDYSLKVIDDLNKVDKKLGKMFCKETHFVSLVPYINIAIEKKIKPNQFADFIAQNISSKDKKVFSSAYAEASSNAAAQNRNIKIRHEEIGKAFKKAFK